MADKAISALPTASALSGTELFAVVQGGSTKKSTAEDIMQYVLKQAAAGDYYAPTGVSLMIKDAFGISSCFAMKVLDDGFGGGGYLDTAHEAIIGGYLRTASYLQVDGNATIYGSTTTLIHDQARIIWTNAGSATFELGPSADLSHLKCFQKFEVGSDLLVDGNIAFGTYAASTGVITGSIQIKDKNGTTVNLMAFL